MKKFILPLFFLSGCFSSNEFSLVAQGPSPKKQKQRIALLQRKLECAQNDYRKAEEEVRQLATEIEEAQLTLIRAQINKQEMGQQIASPLFLEERETLYHMIQSGPSPTAFEAQVELDRILRIITEASDDV